jgi:hypothetical protein
MLLHTTDTCERLLQLAIHPGARVLETHGLRLDPVQKDDPHACERIVIQLAVRLLHQFAPGEALAIERRGPAFSEGRATSFSFVGHCPISRARC